MTTISVRLLSNIIEKSIGMIGSSTPFPILFTTRFGIHTFGMRFPIDVLILDETFHVKKITCNLPPNRVLLWSPLFYTVIELPAGEIKKKNIRMNDIITVKRVQ
jgi:uncharacterized protein